MFVLQENDFLHIYAKKVPLPCLVICATMMQYSSYGSVIVTIDLVPDPAKSGIKHFSASPKID